jgi:ketosteroid isomerase-like protein
LGLRAIGRFSSFQFPVSITSDNVKVRIYDSTAVVTGAVSIKAKTKGQELSVDLLYLEVFVKQAGRWQLVGWESTRRGP